MGIGIRLLARFLVPLCVFSGTFGSAKAANCEIGTTLMRDSLFGGALGAGVGALVQVSKNTGKNIASNIATSALIGLAVGAAVGIVEISFCRVQQDSAANKEPGISLNPFVTLDRGPANASVFSSATSLNNSLSVSRASHASLDYSQMGAGLNVSYNF